MKIVSFQKLQKLFSSSSYLIHFNFYWILYIDIDNFKKRGFEIMIYHDWKKANNIDLIKIISNIFVSTFIIIDYIIINKRSKIRFIIILSRLFTNVEKNYWPIKLEVAKFI